MIIKKIEMNGFNGREEELERIKRYIHPITRVMFYRTNNLIHSRRVLWHLEKAIDDILDVFPGFDVEFTRTLALVHDDVEIITGDVKLHDKEHMSPEELEELTRREMEAISILVDRYSRFANGYGYESLLLTAKNKDRLESQTVSFFDKFDAGGEAWHEVCAGNRMFLRPAGGLVGEGGYVRRLMEFPDKYPNLIAFFSRFPDYLPKPFDFASLADKGRLHTKESLEEDSGYAPYERWKKTIMQREEVELMTTQVEYDN